MKKLLSSRIVCGSSPLNRLGRGNGASSGKGRGAIPFTAAASAATCAGVVPQQPPTRLTSPSRAISCINDAVSAGFSS